MCIYNMTRTHSRSLSKHLPPVDDIYMPLLPVPSPRRWQTITYAVCRRHLCHTPGDTSVTHICSMQETPLSHTCRLLMTSICPSFLCSRQNTGRRSPLVIPRPRTRSPNCGGPLASAPSPAVTTVTAAAIKAFVVYIIDMDLNRCVCVCVCVHVCMYVCISIDR